MFLSERKQVTSECSHNKLGHWQPYIFSLTKLIKKVEQKFNYFIRQTSTKARRRLLFTMECHT